jgi:hypothetical protein
MENRVTENLITSLNSNEVFVFGSNEDGFHGAGAAGFAFRYDTKCNWRNDKFFNEAIKELENGNHKIGRYAIFGIPSGPMSGSEGKSYGIITIKKPGLKRSRSLSEIHKDVEQFLYHAKTKPELNFLVTEIGCNLAGYNVSEIAPLFKRARKISNIYLPQSFWDELNNL